ncbi:valine-tRNA ligase [Ceratobasidium sp. AG-Ba]|nr:valine-tRNA ligase [Ceratobasidium sp. AG-Ba]
MVSTRSKSKPKTTPQTSDPLHGNQDDQRSSNSSNGNRTQKRARHSYAATKLSPKRTKDRQLASSGLMQLPTELLMEVTYLVGPGELIALVRVNKFLRNVFLRRSAIHVWRHAETKDPSMPPCPKNMSEPEYAALYL